MRNLFIVDIEALDSRYTKQWQTHIPQLCQDAVGDRFLVSQISGTPYAAPQAGAFFDFASTCAYKAEQAHKISALFSQGKVKAGDVFFFTDAWNQTIHTVRYISELNDIPVQCVGIWHAGAYDPTDILGVKIKNKAWVGHLEASMAYAYDINFFGTQMHLDKFNLAHGDISCRQEVAGYPLEYIAHLENNESKENIVVFPHRLNDDKAPWLFDMIKDHLHKVGRTDIQFIKTQERNLDKQGYYDLLKRCKVIFSANKHENLGIGTFEAMTAGCIPLVPDKLSYKEMYPSVFKYECGDDIYTSPELYVPRLAQRIVGYIDSYDVFDDIRRQSVEAIQTQFFAGDKIMACIGQL